MEQESTLSRYVEIAQFLWKYRNSGLFKNDDALRTTVQAEVTEQSMDPGAPSSFAADLEAMGPAFVKIGQSLSTRPDMVSPAYIEALSQMQDQCSPVAFDTVREIVEDELGVRISKAFESFSEEPLASASLGQVHRARLRDGREVAVKVQRPDIEQHVSADLQILTQLASKADQHSETGHHLGFSSWISQLRRSLMRELDYETEAGNLETLASLLEGYDRLRVPAPIWDYTSRRVLTMEYIAGIKVPDRSGLRKLEENGPELAMQLTRAYLDQIFIHGFVHVDPHPGNVLLADDGDLALLDLGMVTHLSPRARERMLGLVLAIVDGRGDEAANRAIQMGEPLEDFNKARVVRSVSQLVSEYAASASAASEGLLMLQMTRLAADGGLRPPPEVVLLGKTLLNLEHLSRALAPDLDLRQVVQEHLGEVVGQRVLGQLTPTAVLSNALEAGERLRDLPRHASELLASLADNRFTVKVDAFDEHRFASNMQKIANRVTVGLIVAALIVGAAMLMRIETEATLWGYPAFAMVFFLVAGLLGFGLVLSVLWNDRKQRKSTLDNGE